MFDTNIKTLRDLYKKFPTEQACIDYMEFVFWGNAPTSPFSPKSKVYKCKNGKYFCAKTKKYFTVKTGTMYENTKLSMLTWFEAIWYLTSFKKGISSIQLAKELGITQKTAWFLSHRIRANFCIENYNQLDGIVEADESFNGGKNRFRHRNKKVKNNSGRSYKDKSAIYGMVQRGGKMNAIVLHELTQTFLRKQTLQYVKEGSVFITDDYAGYNRFDRHYNHFVVKNKKNHYVSPHGREINTNYIESAWKVLKCAISGTGTYNCVSRKHLQKYVDEFIYRFNMRKFEQSDRFNWLLLNSGIRTDYKTLTSAG